MALNYSFEKLPQVVNLRGKLPHDGWYNVYSEHYKTDIAVHHSLTTEGNSEAFARYHVYTHGWPEVAYHFVILKDGTIEYNHQLGVFSYHVGNSNLQSIGICLVGDFRSEEPTEAQKQSFRQLHACLVEDLPNYKRTRGHDEFPGYAWKACPEFDYNAVLANKYAASGQEYSGKIALIPGDSGDKVTELQRKLITLGYDLGGYGADGSYGPATESAVKAFQSDHGLTVDGYFGPNTQDKLARALEQHEIKSEEEKRMAENMKATGFPDVDKDAFYAQDVKELVDAGFINGYEDGTYRPNDFLTRGEFAHVINKLRKED